MAKILSYKSKVIFNPKLGYFPFYTIQTDEGEIKVSQYKIINDSSKIETGNYIYPCGMVCKQVNSEICDKNKNYESLKKCKGQLFFYIRKTKITEKNK